MFFEKPGGSFTSEIRGILELEGADHTIETETEDDLDDDAMIEKIEIARKFGSGE